MIIRSIIFLLIGFFILKQKVYETKMANSEAWFEYNDMFGKLSISEEKQKILESYLKVLKN